MKNLSRIAAVTAAFAALLTGPPTHASATVQWSKTSPNPALVTTDLPAPTHNITYNRHVAAPHDKANPWKSCGDVAFVKTWASARPVLTIEVAAGTPRLRVASQGGQRFVLVMPDKQFYCAADGVVNVKSPDAGTWQVFTYERRKTSVGGMPPASPGHTFQLSDATRPFKLEGMEQRTVSLTTATQEPVRLQVRWSSKRSVGVSTNRCREWTLPVRPDALVKVGAGAFDGWLDAPPGTRMFAAPVAGTTIPHPKCDNSGTRVNLGAGKPRTWALWVAPKDGTDPRANTNPVTIALTHRGMRGAATLAPREASVTSTLNARTLQNHYPYLRVGPLSGPSPHRAVADKLWSQADPRLWAFAKPGVRRLRPDEPVLVVRQGRRLAAITLQGAVVRVRPQELALTPAKAASFDTSVGAMPEILRKTRESTRAFVGPELHGLVDKLYAARAKYHTCYEKVFAKHDNTGSAYRKQLVTRRNGRVVKVENWGRKVAAKADRKCKGKRLQKLEDKATKAFNASYARMESARLEERAAGLLKRRAALVRPAQKGSAP